MKTFGVLFSNVDNLSQMKMWEGISGFAARHNIHLVAYLATYQSSGEDLALHTNTCFESIYNSTFLDGVILFSGYISHLIGGDEIYREYVKKIPAHIPAVSIAQAIDGVPSIMTDNVGGIYNVVSHLINEHGKRQIAFIRGPENHQEAEDRLKGYKQALADNGIEFDPAYVLPGDFGIHGAVRSMWQLLNTRKLPFDAIAASDDISALQAIRELSVRGIQVPSDIAVTGFDNSHDAATFVPSLSTSGQDFYTMGRAAAQVLFEKLNGEEPPAITYVPSPFITRQSCGCFNREFNDFELNILTSQSTVLAPFILENVLPMFPPDVSLARWQQWMITLVQRLAEKPFLKKEFLQTFEEILVNFSHRSKQYDIWNNVLNIYMVATQRFTDEIDNTGVVLETLLYANVLVNEISNNEAAILENRQNDIRLALRRISSSLVLTFDIDVLAAELPRLLPQISINMALLGLYAQPIKSSDASAERTIETLVGFDGEQHFNIKHNNWNPIRFSDFTTVDNFAYDAVRRSMFFMPLFFEEEELGVVILPYEPGVSVNAYETLRVNLSTAIKGAELLSKIQTLSVTDELTGLLNRRGFFQFAYARLDYLRRNMEIIPVVMFMDMDGIKMINDTYGHNEGDLAIETFANILKQTLRKEDIIGRIGGDEFVVFSSVKSKDTANHVAQRIRANMDDYNGKNLHPYKVSCSIGSVILEEATGECLEEAIRNADSVLYEEKMLKRKQGISRR